MTDITSEEVTVEIALLMHKLDAPSHGAKVSKDKMKRRKRKQKPVKVARRTLKLRGYHE